MTCSSCGAPTTLVAEFTGGARMLRCYDCIHRDWKADGIKCVRAARPEPYVHIEDRVAELEHKVRQLEGNVSSLRLST